MNVNVHSKNATAFAVVIVVITIISECGIIMFSLAGVFRRLRKTVML